MVMSLVAQVSALRRVNVPLYTLVLLCLLMVVLTTAGILLDPRYVGGAPVWLKPLKFAISTVAYALSILWTLSFLEGKEKFVRVMGFWLVSVLVLELGLIALQAARGVVSHFNMSTPLDGAIYSTMGIAISSLSLDVSKIEEKITAKTKVIIPVDLGGWPCDYNEIMHLVKLPSVVQQFKPASERQQRLGRILVLTDAAHSIGAIYSGRPAAVATDFAVFSFHSVKNITTGEGGAICINLPVPFNNEDEFKFIKFFGLNGQTKSAYEKNQSGSWRYDIIDQGMKVNMPDICAAVGLSQVRRYVDDLLPERKKLYEQYNQLLGQYEWAILPPFDTAEKTSSYHLYMLRIKGFTEAQRDNMISLIAEKEVAVNVHYIPMPMLTLFKNCGYKMEDYPVTYQNYSNEITLPLYNRLSTQEVSFVVSAVVNAYNTLMQS